MASEFTKAERDRNRRDLANIAAQRRSDRKENALNAAAQREAMEVVAANPQGSKTFQRSFNTLIRTSGAVSDEVFAKNLEALRKKHGQSGFLFRQPMRLTAAQRKELEQLAKKRKGLRRFKLWKK
jgi:hypothetical protein